MHRLCLPFLLCCALGVAAPAAAMGAHRYIDAENRSSITLPASHKPVTVTEIVAVAAPDQEEPASLSPQPALMQSVVSPVPEPSGFAMLGLGLFLLLLAPQVRDEGTQMAIRIKAPDSTL
jgi:hypothetical protein